MLRRENPTDDDWYQIWKGHPSALPGFSQSQSSRVYTGLGFNPQIAKTAGKRSFVSFVDKTVPKELQRRIRGDGGPRNAGLVREWRQQEATEIALEARAHAEQAELARGKQRRLRMQTRRPGQDAFRDALIDAYQGQCAITEVSERAALEAAHIEPYDGDATDVVTNGLLLRADLHKLFDARLLWIDDELVVRVAAHVTDACYRQLDGRPLRPPVDLAAQPNVEALRDHRLACCSGGAASSCAAVRRSPALRDEGR